MAFFLSLLLFVPTDVEITTLDGKTVSGELQSLTPEAVELQSGKETVSLPMAQLMTLTLQADKEPAEAKGEMSVVLTDGSRLAVSSPLATADELTAESELGEFAFPRSSVRAVRLQPAKAEWSGEWRAFLKRSNEKDMLVVQKRSSEGLDFLAGVVSAISDEAVTVLVSGNEIPVPRKRVYGVVFARTTERLPGAAAVALNNGDLLKARTVELEDGVLIVDSSWGEFVDVPQALLRSIDFSSGRIHYLSDLEPIKETYFGLHPHETEFDELFADDRTTRNGYSLPWKMSRDQFPNSGRPPLTLRGTVYEKGLCLFPKAQVDYGLDGAYTRFQAVVGVDDDVALNQVKGREVTAVKLEVVIDGQVQWEQLVSADAEPIKLDIDLSDASTLSLRVDFGDGDSTCDFLDLADAKLLVNNEE